MVTESYYIISNISNAACHWAGFHHVRYQNVFVMLALASKCITFHTMRVLWLLHREAKDFGVDTISFSIFSFLHVSLSIHFQAVLFMNLTGLCSKLWEGYSIEHFTGCCFELELNFKVQIEHTDFLTKSVTIDYWYKMFSIICFEII